MNKNFQKGMSKFLSIAVAASIVIGGGSKVKADPNNNLSFDDSQLQKAKEELHRLAKEKNTRDIKDQDLDPEELVRVVVQLEEKPAAEKVEKGAKASPQAIGAVKEAQRVVKAQAETLEGASIRHSYGNLINGFSMDIKRKEVDKLKQMPGVKNVKEAAKYEIDMSNAKSLTQALDAWTKYNLKGEGMLVSIVDTGVDYTHKDMKAPQDASKLKLTKAKVEELKKSGALKADKDASTYFTDKVPYGYNYADRNEEIIDKRPDAGHGMHVAGIVGADGNEEEVKEGNAVKGVAPETQLLAMKVFSNGPAGKSAYTDDVVAAIEDSVTLGADVINMSLGSSANFQDEEDPEQKAIMNATNKGVLVVVSAGNSSYATAPYRSKDMKDIGVVGAPALAKDALMVANHENTKVTSYAADFVNNKGEEIAKGPYSEHLVKFEENKEYSLIDCGVGKPEDFEGKDVKGKVALIIRGGITFVEKILNAQKAGASGVVVFNRAGDNSLINMVTDNAITIPAMFVGNSTGQAVADKLAKGEEVKVKLTGGTISSENPDANDYDDSTSWGAAPNLDFKPQIAAPGGDIFSTVNDNKYENMSGTSMAAPHASGAMALILESIKGYNKNLQGRALVEYAKNIAMNTSDVRMDKRNEGVPYSPRRQGSGLVQIANAIKNKVTATYNGTAAVALKEIKDKKVSFAIDLNNYGDKEVTYSLENFKGVLTSSDEDKAGEMAHDIVLDSKDANITFDKNEVTVKANGSEKVTVTLNIGDNLTTEKFLEGYIKFNSKDSETPSLVVPFMGYYGDWSKERIINYASWEETEHVMAEIDDGALRSYMATMNNKEKAELSKDKNYIAISPNEDGYSDVIIPSLYFLRNAKKVVAEVKDEDGNILAKAGEMDKVRRQIYNAADGAGKKTKSLPELGWDGTVYNNSTGKSEVVKEGQYYLSIKAYVDLEGAKAQEFNVPVKVDLTAPKINVVSRNFETDNKLKLKWTVEDVSGVNTQTIMINGEVLKDVKVDYDEKTKEYSAVLDINKKSISNINISTLDNGGNTGITDLLFSETQSLVKFQNKDFAKGGIDVTKKSLDKEGMFKVSGNISSALKNFKINGKDVQVNKDMSFEVAIDSKDLIQGVNYIGVYAEDMNGNVARVFTEDGGTVPANYSVKMYFDTEAPAIDIASPIVDKEMKVYTNKDEVVIKGSVSDSFMGYTFYINGDVIKKVETEVNYGHEATRYNFEKTIKVKAGDVIELKAVDLYGNETVKTIKITKAGWVYSEGKWYYYDDNGSMQTGWRYVGDKWYYLNKDGDMQTGWIYLADKWYYLNKDGAMETGWQYVGQKWYYMNKDGAMETGWQYVGNQWYYLAGDGAMETGWIYVDSTWYYLNDSGVWMP